MRLNALGSTSRNLWQVSAIQADLVRIPSPPLPLSIRAEPKGVTLDLARTAVVVIDMQNDFCAPGGWLASIGVDVIPAQAPIAPLSRFLPVMREVSAPVIWVNWGNRPDRLNLSPSLLHVYDPTGENLGLGSEIAGTGSRTLEKGSWGAGIVDGLIAAETDIFVDKYRMSGFWDTPLDSILRNLGVTTLMFAGVNSDQCVLCTLQDANFLGYDCLLLDDCAATTSPSYCAEATRYNVKQCFGFVTTAEAVQHALSEQDPTR